MDEGIKGSLPPIRKRLRENRRLLVVLGCLAVFLVLLNKVMQGEIMRIDQISYALIVQKLRAPWLTPVMEAFSALATPVVLIVMLLVIAAFAPGRRPGAVPSTCAWLRCSTWHSRPSCSAPGPMNRCGW